MEASKASNRVLSGRVRGRGLWQAVLPFFHVGGFQVLVRSVCSRWPLRIYERFDAAAVLRDAEVMHATHISVVDKMLQDMLNARPNALSQYECVLLGGGPLNAKTVARALEAEARVYASYGMTETSSQVANTLITPQFTGGMRLLPGYSARIVEPDAEGFGRLALRGPGVFGGYANARAAFTVDGFFLTGDTAALHDGCLYVRERTGDMFISGGENVYPAEIVDALVRVPGVADAYVFGLPDARWGRRARSGSGADAGGAAHSTRALRRRFPSGCRSFTFPSKYPLWTSCRGRASVRSTAPLARRCSARTSTFGAWCFTTAPAVFQAFQNAEGDADLPRYGHCRGDRPQGPRRVRGVHGFRYRLVSARDPRWRSACAARDAGAPGHRRHLSASA